MLDLKYIRNNIEFLKGILANRNAKIDLDRFEQLDEERRELLSEVETLKYKRNNASQEVGKLKRAGEDASHIIEEMGDVSSSIKAIDKKLSVIEEEIRYFQMTIPNVYHESTPVGNDDTDNILVRTWGEPAKFDFDVKPHWELGEELEILDFERGVKLGGSRFTLYRGAGARLERALINFMLDLHTTEHGYTEHLTPILVKPEICEGTGQLPKFGDDMYKTEDDMYLISTSEITLTNIHRGETLSETDLPKYYTAFSPCFRREAGSYGRDIRGLIRQHQFNKVEMVKLAHPNDSNEELEKMVVNAETVLQKLGLPYRVVQLCTGDIGFSATKTYDLEVWLPSEDTYREISSCSNCGDFQARRMGLRFKPAEGGKSEFVHTLNGSGLAVGRTLLAVMENYQQADGSFLIPEALKPYMGGLDVVKK
ncbi:MULTISPECIES: serine--tRNA ligase [Psychrilyobacter]|uniref:Serine--tRNA ligase n=1 Tax=Psychrilyobacter piezotolerans TaxID=2293438 RepID=A0ABX9KE84_9FUSO|nr:MULTISPECIES: serine--tRNA ligase [Psychrilyobacter]MCS5421677.1 serine--tRNA ligase [Psychrilyobacter sp. S5]NDI78819.1 serine--tRNA ligase [Psychrilyobacter piezotolerans]RDE59525.1 serine--tRNA ligase [Psychrilyobacter sp. S5]REI39965.1 serine--tRNA ligase [Psychrilyobacter piezotolerans]